MVCPLSIFSESLYSTIFNLKVAHLSERSDYEGQLTDLRGEYAKTKEELEGEIMVLTKKLDSLEEFRQIKPAKLMDKTRQTYG